MSIETRDLEEYVDRMKQIRRLSTPDLEKVEDAGEYSRILLDNFSMIGKMAGENRKVIEELVKPNLSADVVLTDEVRERLEEFSDLLFDEKTFGEVDINLSDLITNRLMEDDIRSADSGDTNGYVISIAKKVQRDYIIISGLTRFRTKRAEEIRKAAYENYKELMGYIEKDRFATLSEDARSSALHFSIMATLLFESTEEEQPEEYWEKPIKILEEGVRILEDPYYHEMLPEFDWGKYEFRIYYYGSFLAYSRLSVGTAKKAYEYAEKAVDFLKNRGRDDIHSFVNIEQEEDLKFLASIQAGYISEREAADAFYLKYENRDREDYSLTGINKNLDTPASFFRITEKMELGEKDAERYYTIERSVIDYLLHIPKVSSTYLKCVTLVTNFPNYFREVPGAMTMDEFCLKMFAAMHPPTYIHINMVADITESLVRHLFDIAPERFTGFPGCDSVESVIANRERITDFAYHAALCHDLGKLFILDVITMYGRSLLDEEFALIKKHPVIGAQIAAKNNSTKEYVDVIKGHHLWYDCSRGYPEEFDTFKSPYKTIIDIVMAADCLDAATDSVGRSYNKGKNFDDYKKEVIDGSGTRYAPFLTELFNDPGVKQDVEYLLTERRSDLYRKTFKILKNNEIDSISIKNMR